MIQELSYNELAMIDGGVNGWLMVGGALMFIGGVAECATGALSPSGVMTAVSGASTFIMGCK